MNKYFSSLFFLLSFLACEKQANVEPTPISITVVSKLEVIEGNSNNEAAISIAVEGTIQTNVVVSYKTSENSARQGLDYRDVTNGQIIFSDNITQDIKIPIIGDTFEEQDESFFLEIFSTNDVFPPQSVEVKIINDDQDISSLQIPEGYSTPSEYAGMNLIWSDEFDNDSLDPSFWNHDLGDGCPNLCGWGNRELQRYQEENIFMKEGYLVIQTRNEGENNYYTSARINTKDKYEFQYGRVDIRALCPEGKGLWPALWMLGSNIDDVSWPACGEIDIMELIGDKPEQAHGTFHYGESFDLRQSKGVAEKLPLGRKYSEAFHVFSMIWQEDEVQLLIDDKVINTISKTEFTNQNYPFNQPFYFIFNVAIGGQWPGSPDGSTMFPQHFVIDYVRVFQ